jgi:ACT domain-containing protein
MAELSEQDIRRLAEEAVRQLGRSAAPGVIEEVVKQALQRLDKGAETEPAGPAVAPKEPPKKSRNRIIITAFGKNKPGILAGLTGVLAGCNCDILDLSQKILQDFFTIMLLVDISSGNTDFETIKNDIVKQGEELDLKVIVQHEEIFNTMHRI